MNGKHLKSLDGLRGLAVLLIIFYHGFPHRGIGVLGYLSSISWFSVDLFFALSGFLITGILFEAQETPGYYRNFYARRSLRLLPVYILYLAILALIPHQPNGYPWWVSLAYVAYASNIVFFFIPAFQLCLPLVANHLWTLSVEEQFYILWPWVIARLSTRRRILTACFCGAVASLALRLFLTRLHLPSYLFLYWELPTRADSILLGAAAAMLYRIPGFLDRHRPKLRLAATLATLLFLGMGLRVHTFFFGTPPIATWGYALIDVTVASVLLLAAYPGSWIGRIFSNSVLRFYGKISYSLYLIHATPYNYEQDYLYPVFARTFHSLLLTVTVYFFVILALSTALAYLSFRFVEMPFMKLKKYFPQHAALPSKSQTVPAS